MTAVAAEMVRIGLIDGSSLYREGLKNILVAIEDFTVIGEADDVRQAVEEMPDEKPAVILLQVRTPDGEATESVRHLCEAFPESRVIVLSMDGCLEVVLRLSSLGISGYLTNATRQELVAAIRCSLERDNQIMLSMSREVIAQMAAAVSPMPPAPPPLTPRELEILSLTSQALSNTQIARQAFLTEATVKRHLRNIFTKLGAVSRIDAVNKAVAAGLLPAPLHSIAVPAD
jgi:DNA-binding NarL/FixJ family response regulator